MSFLSRIREFGPLKYLISKATAGGLTLRAQQEQLDYYRAAVLLHGHSWFEKNVSNEDNKRVYKVPTESEIEGFYSDVDKMSPKAIKQLVQNSVDLQLRKMFKQLDDHSIAVEKMSKRRHLSQTVESFLSLEEGLGFELECRQSKIPNAGTGVFIKGEVAPGTVIALFPGIVHLAEFVSSSDYLKKLLPDDDFNLLMRPDGHVIDSRRVDETPANPYAMGHKVNHMPIGYQPNCIQIPYNFPTDPLGLQEFPPELLKYAPYKYEQAGTFLGSPDRSVSMYGMVLIAAKPLGNDDEVYVDYRLNPDAEVPSWYRTFDKEAAKRRWVDDNPIVGSVYVKEVAEKEPFKSNYIKKK